MDMFGFNKDASEEVKSDDMQKPTDDMQKPTNG